VEEVVTDRVLGRRPWQRHLNKVRWLTLTVVFAMLVLLPMISVYQTYVAAHGYDLLSPSQKVFYDVMEAVTSFFTDDPANDLDAVKGTTWSGRFFGLELSDPLAVAGQMAAGLTVHWPFLLSAVIPILATLLMGRFYCGWICPATFLYELNSNVAALLRRAGFNFGRRRLDRRLKYLVLLIGLLLSGLVGSVWVALVYPPAIIGRELYFAIAPDGFGAGAVFFVLTLAFDILVAKRGFCRYLCPGGALYSLLGRYRLLRIRRDVTRCNDCVKCNAICEFGLNPMRDDFGQECNNCTACMAACPTDALHFSIALRDLENQGKGHLSPRYRRRHAAKEGA